jgi:large subunit ribosomal protein L6
MSRIGKKSIIIPKGVEVSVSNSEVRFKGPKGSLIQKIHPDMKVEVGNGEIRVSRPSDSKLHRSLHGLTRTLISNGVEGVSKGYEKVLEVVGVGYRVEQKSKTELTFSLGYSHPINYIAPEGIEFKVEKSIITITGNNKELVGFVSAKIRSFRKPEPYKGKGIKYTTEQIRRKAGKTATSGGAGGGKK